MAKEKVNEIDKVLVGLLGDFNFSNIDNKRCAAYPSVAVDPKWLRRRLRALVRKASVLSQNAVVTGEFSHQNAEKIRQAFKIDFGIEFP